MDRAATLAPCRGKRERPWHVFAVDLRVRAKRRKYVEATSWTEAEALRDLSGLLRAWHVEVGRRHSAMTDRAQARSRALTIGALAVLVIIGASMGLLVARSANSQDIGWP